MGNYVTGTGLARKTLQEVRLEIENSLKQAFGPSFETSVDSPNGLLINQLALAISSQWELAQEVFVSRDPAQAEGMALDWAADLTGVTRKGAVACQVPAVLYTDTALAEIPAGSSAMRSRGNLEFILDGVVSIDRAACSELMVVDDGSSRNKSYTFNFTFGAVTLNNTSTTKSNLEALRDLLQDISGIRTELTATGLRIYTGTSLQVGLTGNVPTDFEVWAGELGQFTAVEEGSQTCDIGELDSIPDAVTGWVAVYNYEAGLPGSDAETDEELRLRRAQSAKSIHIKGTDDAVAAHLRNDVAGVVTAEVRSNRSMTEDAEGRPPKSFEALVVGGRDRDVAQNIYENQAGGIQSYGNTSVIVTDSNGDEQVISFSRPEPLYLWLDIAYTPYMEEAAPTDTEIKAALMEWARKEYTIGKDVIPDRVKGGLYENTSGIGPSVVKVAVTVNPDGTPSYTDSVQSVGYRRYAILDESRITLHGSL